MRITLLYFAAAREAAGCSRESVELSDGATAGAALELACERHPRLRPLTGHLRFAIDQAFATAEAPLRDQAEVALIPPVAGG